MGTECLTASHRRAGLDDITFHGLRHSFVAIMVAAGCNVREVSEWAGHNSVAFTLTRYGGLFEDNTDAAIDRLDALLGGFCDARESREVFPSATNPLAVPQLERIFADLSLRSRSWQQERTPPMSIWSAPAPTVKVARSASRCASSAVSHGSRGQPASKSCTSWCLDATTGNSRAKPK